MARSPQREATMEDTPMTNGEASPESIQMPSPPKIKVNRQLASVKAQVGTAAGLVARLPHGRRAVSAQFGDRSRARDVERDQ